MTKIEETVYNLLEPIVIELGYELYDVEYSKEGKDFYLRIFIDNKNGINLEDCEKVSNRISDLLDSEDVIKEQYFLEVSSPGIERILRENKHFNQNRGKEIEIKLFKPIQNMKSITGILKDFNDENIYLENASIERKNISQIKLVYNW